MADSDKKIAATYVAWGTFKNALDQLTQGVPPNRIDRSVFPGMAWAIQNQLFTGMKFLGLIDEHNRPTAELEAICLAPDDERKIALAELLRKRYSHLFALDLKKTTPNELAQRMGEAYGVSGDTREKAVRFFVSAAEFAGVELSPLFDTSKKANGSAVRPALKRKPRSKVANEPSEAEEEERNSSAGTSRTVALKSGGTLTLSASLDLFALKPADRKFVFGIIDLLDGYEKETTQPVEPTPERGMRSAPRARPVSASEGITDDDVPF